MCFRIKLFDIISKFTTRVEYLQALVTNSEHLQVILHLLTNMNQYRKRLLNFSECCEWCHSPSIFVRQSAFVTFAVSHSLRMSYSCCRWFKFKKKMSPASYSLRIYTDRSLAIKFSNHAQENSNGNVGKTFASFTF